MGELLRDRQETQVESRAVTFKASDPVIFYKNMLGKAGGGRGGLMIVSQGQWLTYLWRSEKVQL